jgi:hypothetical protein
MQKSFLFLFLRSVVAPFYWGSAPFSENEMSELNGQMTPRQVTMQTNNLTPFIRLPLGKWTRLMFVNYFDVSSPNNVVGNVSIQLKLLLWKARAEAKIVTFS